MILLLLSFVFLFLFIFFFSVYWRKQAINGEAKLEAVCGELLHNEREWEAKEESWASEPRKSTASGSTQTETIQD